MEFLEDIQQTLSFVKTHPWLVLLVVVSPLILLARRQHIYPTKRLIALLAVPCVASLLLLLLPDLYLALAVLDILVVAAAILDLATLPDRRSFEVERTVGLIASLEKPHPVTLCVSNLTPRIIQVEVRDDVNDEFVQTPDMFTVRLNGRSRAVLHYQLTVRRRGAFQLENVYLRVPSVGGIWHRYLVFPHASRLHVYPNMQQMGEYATLARTNRLSLMGVRRTRRIGQDNEFERLRDYTLDDNYKHIDWRSTARRNKLTVKDYQMNQSQRVVFLIDCGRMMTNTAQGISLLDHAFNAMLMMSYVALKQGDAVGLLCFSDRVHTYVPPHGGLNQMNRLLHASFDRFPKLVESRYDEAFLYLSSHCKKRSLVILVTNVIDEVNANQVQQYLRSMSGKHLPLGILLRDRSLFEAVDQQNLRGFALYRAAAAASILDWRDQVLTDLQHSGVLSIDTFPEHMTAPLVNRYLEIKARHLL